MKAVLIVSARGEYHADRIADFCESRHANVIRLYSDLDTEVERLSFQASDANLSWFFHLSEDIPSQPLNQVSGVLFFYPLDETLQRRNQILLNALADAVEPSKWVNHPIATRRAWDKLHVFRVASRFGLKFPETQIGNAFDEEFWGPISSDSLLCKPIFQPLFLGEEGSFASLVDRSDLEANAEQLQACPLMFQTFIEKAAEISVYVVGDQVFATAVDSATLLHKVDFRQNNIVECAYEHHILPDELKEACLNLVHQGLGLKAANLDFALDRSGRYFLLDCNPFEKWGVVEEKLRLPIAASYADLLCQH